MPVPTGYIPEDMVRPAYERSTAGTQTTAAGVTRAQWQHFLDVYRPLEDQVLQRAMQTDFTAEGDRSGQMAAAGLASSAGTYERNLRRAGVALSAEERNAVARRRSTSQTRAVAGAENVTRRGMKEQRTNLLAQMVGIGRGVASTAMGGMNAVADLEAQRAVAREQSKAQGRQMALSTAASLASYGIALGWL